jgi:hypothetical protein
LRLAVQGNERWRKKNEGRKEGRRMFGSSLTKLDEVS